MSKPAVKQQFAHFDNNIYPFQIQEGTIIDKVPAAYYHVKKSIGGYYLEKKSDNVPLPEKIYGSATARAKRFWKTYDAQTNPMAVGLFGAKGAGKTLLSSVVSNIAIGERGLPVVDVSNSFSTESGYLEFLNTIGECVIIFDEFLKHLGKLGDLTEHSQGDISAMRQDEMLTFFSGTQNPKRLVVLIDNQKHQLSDFFRDRPGRMHYMFQYHGVEKEVVEALCKDAGLSQSVTDELVTYTTRRRQVTFDSVNAIIKELVLYPEDTLEYVTSILNVPDNFKEADINVKVVSFVWNKENTGNNYRLKNQLAKLTSADTVVLEVEYENPLFGKVFANEEELDQFTDDYGWDWYQKNKDTQWIADQYRVGGQDLVAVRGDTQVYKGNCLEVAIELMPRAAYGKTSDFSFFDEIPGFTAGGYGGGVY